MSEKVRQVIEDVKKLFAKEKALVAHCLISSLDVIQDKHVDSEWADLAEARYKEIISGKTKTRSWDEIKKEVKG